MPVSVELRNFRNRGALTRHLAEVVLDNLSNRETPESPEPQEPGPWITTRAMARALGVHPCTLRRLKARGFFTYRTHYRKKDPHAPRGNFLWHRERVLAHLDKHG